MTSFLLLMESFDTEFETLSFYLSLTLMLLPVHLYTDIVEPSPNYYNTLKYLFHPPEMMYTMELFYFNSLK